MDARRSVDVLMAANVMEMEIVFVGRDILEISVKSHVMLECLALSASSDVNVKTQQMNAIMRRESALVNPVGEATIVKFRVCRDSTEITAKTSVSVERAVHATMKTASVSAHRERLDMAASLFVPSVASDSIVVKSVLVQENIIIARQVINNGSK